jgi:hypothetical protein
MAWTLFDGMRGWWRMDAVADYVAGMPPYQETAGQTLRASVLAARYPGAPIYRALAIESGYDPLRAVELG